MPSGVRFPGTLAPLSSWCQKRRRVLLRLVAAALLAQMAFAMLTTAREQTPTYDEPAYVGTAVAYTREHSLRHNPEHPPLGKLLIAIGTSLAQPHFDTSFERDQVKRGQHLLYDSGNDPWRLMLFARLPVIALTLLFGLVVLAFARELTGPVGGLAALALYAFTPDVIAHGSLATLDVPASGFALTSVWLLWRARTRSRLGLHLVGAGAALGAAVAVKMNMLAAIPVVVLLTLLTVRAHHEDPPRGYRADSSAGRPWRHTYAPLLGLCLPVVAVLGVAVAMVWASYLAVDPHLRWTAPPELPQLSGLRALAVDALPFPRAYRDGMRIQFGFEDHKLWQGYLYGHKYRGTLWYYLPAALLVKTPIGLMVLGAAGAAAMLTVARLRPAAPYVLFPPAVLLAAAMTGSSRDLGVRYAIFVPIFATIAAAGLLGVRRCWARLGTAVLVAFAAVSSLLAFPYYLPYSNEAFGGPAETHLWLHDSNVDWGQDLGRLADRLRERYGDEERVWLVYQGTGVPSAYGIEASDPRRLSPERVHGLLIVSNSWRAKAEGRLAELLRTSRPIDQVGYSITLFRRP